MQKLKQQNGDNRKRLKQIIVGLSLLAFIGGFGYSTIQLYITGLTQNSESEVVPSASSDPNAELKAQERGYLLVLEREPENPVALEGLVNVRLDMNDAKGAIEPLTKLVELYPDRTDYKTQLQKVQEMVQNDNTVGNDEGGDR